MTTFLYGAYGTGNLGDDILLKSALQHHEKDTVAICYGRPFLEEQPQWIDHDAFIENPSEFISAGDQLIFAGGGLFWAASHADDMRKVALEANKIGADVSIERIGAQGVHSNIEAAQEMMAVCSRISVRDEHSVSLLKELNVTDAAIYEPDFAMVLDIPERKMAEKPLFGVNHSATPFFHDPDHRKKALHCYQVLVERFPDVDFTYVPHTRHFRVLNQNDVIYGEYFWNATGGRMANPCFPNTVEELLQLYSTLWGVVGWRYHLVATATRFGAPAAFFGQLGGHKYGAFASEHKLPQIDFNLETRQIIPSLTNFVNKAIKANGSAEAYRAL
tara:strand:- start:24 stop:1016 length:993 start_codon:yes stop_codon:yes gene_type:complete